MENQQPFHRLQGALSKIISETAPGDRLPAEPLLAKSLGVSRATLREAMRAFESQGLILRRQGIGTFVVSRHEVIESGLEVLESIETLAKKIGLNVSMGDLQIDRIRRMINRLVYSTWRRVIPLLRVRRTILTEARPVAYLIDILPEDMLKHSDLQTGFTGSVLDLLLRRSSLPLSKSIANIQAEAASSEVARALQIQRGDVLLVFIAQLFEADGRMVDYSTSFFLPGYFRFHVVRSLKKDNI